MNKSFASTRDSKRLSDMRKKQCVESGRKREALLDRKRGFLCPRRSRNGWAGPPEASRRAPENTTGLINPVANYRVLQGGRKKREFRFFGPVGKLGGQVAVRKKGMSTYRPIRSLKDNAQRLYSCLASPWTGYISVQPRRWSKYILTLPTRIKL